MNETALRAVDGARQQAVTTERSARETVRLLRDVVDHHRAHEGLRVALRDADSALETAWRLRVSLDVLAAAEEKKP